MPSGIYARSKEMYDSRRGRKRPDHSEFMKKYNPNWKGGKYIYNHNKAFELYGTCNCELCGITLEEYKLKHPRSVRFSMHCRDGNYSNLEEDNWNTVCEYGCHQKMDRLDLRRRYKK